MKADHFTIFSQSCVFLVMIDFLNWINSIMCNKILLCAYCCSEHYTQDWIRYSFYPQSTWSLNDEI